MTKDWWNLLRNAIGKKLMDICSPFDSDKYQGNEKHKLYLLTITDLCGESTKNTELNNL